MTWPRSLTFSICLAAFVLAAAGPASAAPSAAHQMSVTSHGTTVQGNLFTYCQMLAGADGIGMGTCADGIPSVTATRLPVDPRGSVAITTGAPVTEISARYGATDGPGADRRLTVTPLDASGQRFTATLPAGPPAELLIVSTRYKDLPAADGKVELGDAHFSVGLRQRRAAKATPRRITAQATVSCRPPASGVRRCRLDERGAIVLPSGASCRDGRVRVRVLARGRRVLQVIAGTGAADCRYQLRGRAFAVPSGAGRVLVETRFLGSPTLVSRNAPDLRLRVR